MQRSSVVLLLLLAVAPALAREKTDVVYMKNGDRLTCEIKGLNSGVLYISVAYLLGTQSLQWSEIQRVDSKQLFIVKTEDGNSYVGTLSTIQPSGARPVKIEVAEESGEKAAMEGPQIVQMAETSEKLLERFNGAINSGIIYSKGNQATQYTLSSEVTYPRERWAASASVASNLSSSTGATAATRNDVGLDMRRLLPWNNWFYSFAGDFLQSSVQGIRLQSTVDGGIGRYLKNTNLTQISLIGGLAWQSIKYHQSTTTLPQQNVAAALIGAKAKFFRFDKTDLEVTTGILPALSEPGRIHLTTNAAYYIKLFSNLKWNISFYGNWDNRPPPGFSGSDYGTSSGLGWTFGNR